MGYTRRWSAASNTGSTLLRLALVQQPNTTVTRSSRISLSAWRAKVAGSEAPSAITHRRGRPRMPPAALISSSASTSASIIDFSLTAIGPVCECRSPTRIGRRSTSSRSSASQPRPARSAAPISQGQRQRRRTGVVGSASRPRGGVVERSAGLADHRRHSRGPGGGSVQNAGAVHHLNLCPSFPTGRIRGAKFFPGPFRRGPAGCGRHNRIKSHRWWRCHKSGGIFFSRSAGGTRAVDSVRSPAFPPGTTSFGRRSPASGSATMASVPKHRAQPFSLERIAGVSAWAEQVRRAIELVAVHQSSVLILGPSGTGKELIARAIHSSRQALRQALHSRRLRSHHRYAVREPHVRPREGLVHRRDVVDARLLPSRRRRHDLPRRDRGDGARAPGEAAPRAPAAGGRARWAATTRSRSTCASSRRRTGISAAR